MINALTYEWTQEIEDNVRNIPKQQKEDKRAQQLKQEISREMDERTRFEVINDTLHYYSGKDDRIYMPTDSIMTLIK